MRSEPPSPPASALAALAALAGCVDAEGEPLIDHALWEQVDAADDPFDDRPEAVDCPSSSWAIEVSPEVALEIDTGQCDYLALTQPSLAALTTSLAVELRAGHDALESDDVAEAHFALQIGDALLDDRQIQIPSDADEWTEVIALGAEIPAGTPIWLHLHNHGSNTWKLYTIDAIPEPQ